jgi:hypothetical protein
MLVFFPHFFCFQVSCFFLLEKPRVSFHVFVYWSGHASCIDIRISFRRHYRIFEFDISDCQSINHVNGKGKARQRRKQKEKFSCHHKSSDRQCIQDNDNEHAEQEPGFPSQLLPYQENEQIVHIRFAHGDKKRAVHVLDSLDHASVDFFSDYANASCIFYERGAQSFTLTHAKTDAHTFKNSFLLRRQVNFHNFPSHFNNLLKGHPV